MSTNIVKKNIQHETDSSKHEIDRDASEYNAACFFLGHLVSQKHEHVKNNIAAITFLVEEN